MASQTILLLLLAATAGAFQAPAKQAVIRSRNEQIPGLDSISGIIDSAQEAVGSAGDTIAQVADTASGAVSSVASTVNGAVDTANGTMQTIQDYLFGNASDAPANSSNDTNASAPTPVAVPIPIGPITQNMTAAEVSAGVAKVAAAQLVKARLAYDEAEANATKAAEVGLAAAQLLAERANETTEASNRAIGALSDALAGAPLGNISIVNSSVEASKSADEAVAAAGLAVVAVTEYQAFKAEAQQAKSVSLQAAHLVADSVEKTISSSRNAERALQETMSIFEDQVSETDLVTVVEANLTKSGTPERRPLARALAAALALAAAASLQP